MIVLFLVTKSVVSQDTIILRPGPEGKDALCHTILPDNNYGNIQMFKSMAWTHWGEPGRHRSMIEFDLSMIPPDAIILQASLSLYFATFEITYVPHTGDNDSYLLRITEPWEEDEVTWNNQPATTMENMVILPQSTDPEQDYPDIDVTDQIQLMVSEPENNHGFMLQLITEVHYRSLMFASGDCENPDKRPMLEIIYMGCTPPTVDFEYQADGQSVSFTGISPTAINWHWDFGDGDTSNLQNPEHYFEEPGFYNVCLVVEDTCYFAEHCEVLEICTGPPVAGFTYTIDELSVYFQDTSNMASEFYWDFGDGYFSNLANPWHAYQAAGTYQVCLTTWNSCGSDTVCEMIDVCSPPVSDFDFTIEDLTVFFEDYSQMADEYYWDFGDGYFSSLANPIHTYDTGENYQVCLTTRNECGADTVCDMLYLTTVSVSESGDGLFKVFPNPARDAVYMKTLLTGQVDIRLVDLSGKVVLQQYFDLKPGETLKLSLAGVNPGLYIVRIDSEKSQSYGKLMIVN